MDIKGNKKGNKAAQFSTSAQMITSEFAG